MYHEKDVVSHILKSSLDNNNLRSNKYVPHGESPPYLIWRDANTRMVGKAAVHTNSSSSAVTESMTALKQKFVEI